MYLCSYHLSGEDKYIRLIRETEDYLIHQHSPNNFNAKDPENSLSQQDRAFEKICITLEENGAKDPLNLSEFSFYSRLNYLEEKFNKGKPNNEFIAE